MPRHMYHFLGWVEQTQLSVWLRESPSLLAFPFVLILHTVGMGFLVGTNVAMDLRILGFAPRVPLSLLQKFFPVMGLGFFVNRSEERRVGKECGSWLYEVQCGNVYRV